MFSIAKQNCVGNFIRNFLKTKQKSFNSFKSFSIGCTMKNVNMDEHNVDLRKDLNIFRTFTAKLRPDLMEESIKFNALFPDVKREIVTYIERCTNKETAEYIDKCLQYNVPNGKQFRPMQIILGYKDIADKDQQTPEKMRQLYMICWALEIVNTIVVIHDDMIDGGLVRRNSRCWHTLDDVGMHAVSDYILVLHSGYFLLKNHCKDLACYSRLFEYISEGVFFTHMGQTMNKFIRFDAMADVDNSLKNMRQVHLTKTGHFLFYTPMSMLMALTGHNNREFIKHICAEMGYYHQCQNDVLDIFDISGVLQKTTNDIENGECSWLATTCMQRGNDEQKRIMIENYGKKDPKCSERVKQLFIDMSMLELYREFAYEKYDSIRALIVAAECDEPVKNVLYNILDLLFHRSMVKSN
ncbi:farnesyl pyrophosphate synthase-like [Contarinia nasturtii]|uniref:farnesyl pyrophosphate synthase-like n=1 Tax=Contarinia nasturtii TaxID=265458 RepID=UPI0012D49EF4|nr:farnesyl pyrophosphate synthase-like [Contarinia nasturtii]